MVKSVRYNYKKYRKKGIGDIGKGYWVNGEWVAQPAHIETSPSLDAFCPVMYSFLRQWSSGVMDDEVRAVMIEPLWQIAMQAAPQNEWTVSKRAFYLVDKIVRNVLANFLYIGEKREREADRLWNLDEIEDLQGLNEVREYLDSLVVLVSHDIDVVSGKMERDKSLRMIQRLNKLAVSMRIEGGFAAGVNAFVECCGYSGEDIFDAVQAINQLATLSTNYFFYNMYASDFSNEEIISQCREIVLMFQEQAADLLNGMAEIE